jgi:heme-degrading monooxygenase HmoA
VSYKERKTISLWNSLQELQNWRIS